MLKSKRAVSEIYVFLLYADHSLLKMGRTLFRYRYEIGALPLDQAEVQFREVFGLPRYEGQAQDMPLQYTSEKGETRRIFVTQQFYERIHLERVDAGLLLTRGYLVYLKKSKAWDPALYPEIDDRQLIPEMDEVRRFTLRLANSLRLNRPGSFAFGELFSWLPADKRVIRSNCPPLAETAVSATPDCPYSFLDKDNYALKVLLDIEDKLSGYIELAVQAFLSSFQVKNIRLRYLQLLLSMELCFNRSSEDPAEAICRYASILLAHDKSQFLTLYDEIRSLYSARTNIMHGDGNGNGDLHKLAPRLEELTREVLKKMVRLNPQKRENLIEDLRYKRL